MVLTHWEIIILYYNISRLWQTICICKRVASKPLSYWKLRGGSAGRGVQGEPVPFWEQAYTLCGPPFKGIKKVLKKRSIISIHAGCESKLLLNFVLQFYNERLINFFCPKKYLVCNAFIWSQKELLLFHVFTEINERSNNFLQNTFI